jgi:glycosyltransferase involved in cell wall biosynthesis
VLRLYAKNCMTPLISILIPAFNAEEWIADAIKSAIAQSWQSKEIVIVDDGSTDETLAIARRFASKKVVVLTQENQGAAIARNHALDFCQGDFIQWLDADDLLSPDKVKKQMEAAQAFGNTLTLLSSEWGYFAYRTGRAKFQPTALWCDLLPLEWLLRKMENNLHMQTGTWLVSRELTEAAGPWDGRLLRDNDGEYFCRVILASDSIHFVPGARVFYRITSSNRVSYIGDSDKKKDAQWLSMQLHVKYIRSLEESDRVRAACTKFLQTWLIHFYPERPEIVQAVESLAASFGASLHKPRLRWKYAWITPLLGWRAAKRAQLFLPQLKMSLTRSFDRAIYSLERYRLGASPALLQNENHNTESR